jgi:RHS repeat-associated protein
LLGITEVATATAHYVADDGSANVIGLVSSVDGTWTARYEYDPFGGVVSRGGQYAGINPFGYSTKYRDAETGLLDYGRRYYTPALGRWLSRDPAEETGGLNLHAAFLNSPANHFDETGERSQPYDWHHNYPQTFRWFFESKGMKIDEADFGVMLLWPDHQAFKTQFQAEWKKFVYSDTGRNCSKACVIEHFEKVIKPQFTADYAKSVKADVSHGKWSQMTPADKLKLVSPRFAKVVKVAAAIGTIAQIAQGAEWLNSADRAANMIELVNALEKSGGDRALEIYIWADSHLPGFAKIAAGKITADLADKPPLSSEAANRLRAGFLATLEETEP